MEHYFNTNIAKTYGIEEAILLHHFYFWIAKNAANGKHFHDGLYWTYNSKKAYADFFTYMNETKIFRVIKHLEDEGVVVKGKYNKDKWDKTNWYAITQKGLELLKECGYEMQPFSTSLQNDIFDSGKMNDGALQSEQSILINNTDRIDTSNNKEKEIDKSISKKGDELFETCWVAYRRKGSKKKSIEYWKKISDKEKEHILPHIKAYVQSREIQYQKDFERYLRDKIYQTVVFSSNKVVYDPTKGNSGTYTPICGGALSWNDYYNCYMYVGYWDGRHIADGYNDDNRPHGATITLNNGRGTITWNRNTKQWEKV